MYWPIGAPRIYAASTSNAPRGHTLESDDDAESRETTEGSGSLVNAPSTISGGDQEDGRTSPDVFSDPPKTPRTPGIRPVEQDGHHHLSARSLGDLGASINSASRDPDKEPILSIKLSRAGHLFATITNSTLTIWQTKPTAVLAAVLRSPSSLHTYGPNTGLLVRPDSAIFVVQTTHGYLITYSLASDPDARVYKPNFDNRANGQKTRQGSFSGFKNYGGDRILWGAGEGGGVREVSIKFRMVIRIDAGIERALALDDELVVATQKPPAVQCIRWTPDKAGNQTRTELLSRMGWVNKKTKIVEMIHDRPMNLFTWITDDGCAYAVQRALESKEPESSKKLFRGYCFHSPTDPDSNGIKAAINARFSLIAVGCSDGSIHVYNAKDYVGNIPLSHKQTLPVSASTSGKLTFLSYSPDGYCLFAGYENGWATWSVFGKPGSNSFVSNQNISDVNHEGWLTGVSEGIWIGGGSELLLIGKGDTRIWVLEMARSAVTGSFSSANISRTLLLTKSSLMVYRGYDLPDLTTISAEASLWHNAQIPSSYLVDQWPMRCAVISPEGRYVAVAGRRGLAHYSLSSGRWKTFVNENMENSFLVRGGMCWYQHILVAAVEAGNSYQLRLFSREAALDNNVISHVEDLPAPVVLIAQSGDDSLLVYTYDNILYHYIFTAVGESVQLVPVGQIAFNGIVRSPARVRGLSWILPEEQRLEGDPSQDVSVAAVLFLVDGNLVLLQPSINEENNLKYDMRIIAQNIEYYVLTRDQPLQMIQGTENGSASEIARPAGGIDGAQGLRDSLWMFDGNDMKVWVDIHEVLQSAPVEANRELPIPVAISLDFYPSSVLIGKGILLGVEPELVQRRDMGFALFRVAIRTHLFIPPLLKFHLSRYDSPAALHLAQQYQNLTYFAHALEVLLHDVLDEEVDTTPSPDTALLPSVLSFLSSFPQYLDIVVQCTRKTEVRSWRTLFAYLPPPQELFEESLQKGALKTAGGYLLVLHTFEELSSSSEQLVRLLGRAKDEGDWELCKELARFLTALDESGATLREALTMVDVRSSPSLQSKSFMFEGSRMQNLQVPPRRELSESISSGASDSGSSESRTSSNRSPGGGKALGLAVREKDGASGYFENSAVDK